MPTNFSPPGYGWFRIFRNAAVRVGIYTGVCLSLVFLAWVVIANRAPLLEPVATLRNLAAALLLIFLATMPVLRFFRHPGDLLLSGLIAWSLLSLTYVILTLSFSLLEDYYSAFRVFVLGVLAYLLFATLAWVGMMIWRARAAEHTHLPR